MARSTVGNGRGTWLAVAGLLPLLLGCGSSSAPAPADPADAAPAFTLQPGPATVAAGQGATFQAAASGLPAPTLQWQRLDPGAVSWLDVAGATGTAYSTPPTAERDTGTRYRAMATNRAGSAASSAVTLTVRGTPPTVLLLEPSDLATNVPTGTAVRATFSEPVAPTTSTGLLLTLSTSGGTPVAGSVTVSGATATFAPAAPLAAGVGYTARLDGSIEDLHGNALGAARTWSFTTAALPDTTPPTVASTTPPASGAGVAVDAVVTATLSEPLDPATVGAATFALRLAPNGPAVSGTLSVAGATLTFTPSTPLSPGSGYTARLGAAIADRAGNHLGADYTWSFTTAGPLDTTPPTVVGTMPPGNALAVAVNAVVTVAFSEPVAASTVTTSSFTLTEVQTGAAVVPASLSVVDATVTFTPTTPLSPGTEYAARLGATITDLAGNPLRADGVDYTWRFTTAVPPDTTPPTVVGTTPPSNGTGVAVGAAVSVTFTEPVAPGTVTSLSFALREVQTGAPATPASLSVVDATVTFTPTMPLSPGTTYAARLDPTITDLAGNPLGAEYVWTFTTAAPPPTVVATAPPDGASWVPVDEAVTLEFSEAMDPASITAASVQLQGPSGAVPANVTGSGTTATLVPTLPLCHPCGFVVTVTSDARAADGRSAAPTSFSFTTGRVPAQASPRLGAGGIQTLALPSDGTVWSWGTNAAGAVGDGSPDWTLVPRPVQLAGLSGFLSVDGAAWYSLALAADGTVWGWGWVPGGSPRSTPAPIDGLTGVAAISAGYQHALGLRRDGTVMGWGSEAPYVLGPATGASTPRQLPGLADIVAVSAGESFSLALRSDGVVLTWGNDTLGELGDGGGHPTATPRRVPGLAGVTAVAAQSFTGVALRHDGTVWGWGHNAEGEAGTGSPAAIQAAPAQVLTGAMAIATGNYHALALLGDGTVRGWGYNGNGRLGDGSSANRSSPVGVVGLTGAAEISGGEFHSAARRGDGTLWTWGADGNGQLGGGAAGETWVPVQVAGFDFSGAGGTLFTVGGTVSGLAAAGLVLQLNGAGDLAVGADGPFAFPTRLHDGDAYAVTVAAQPTGQTCAVASGSGTIAQASLASVAVTCAP